MFNLFGIESIGLFTIIVLKIILMLVQLGKLEWMAVSLKLLATYFITTVVGQLYFGIILLLSIAFEYIIPHEAFLVLFLGGYVLLLTILDDWFSRRFLLNIYSSITIRQAILLTNLITYTLAISIFAISIDI